MKKENKSVQVKEKNGIPTFAGRPRKALDEEQVFRLAAIHCTVEEIAGFFGVGKSMIYERYAEALNKGREAGKISLRKTQTRMARKGSAAMAIWLGKQYLEQRDQNKDDLKDMAKELLIAIKEIETGSHLIPISGSPMEDEQPLLDQGQRWTANQISNELGTEDFVGGSSSLQDHSKGSAAGDNDLLLHSESRQDSLE